MLQSYTACQVCWMLTGTRNVTRQASHSNILCLFIYLFFVSLRLIGQSDKHASQDTLVCLFPQIISPSALCDIFNQHKDKWISSSPLTILLFASRLHSLHCPSRHKYRTIFSFMWLRDICLVIVQQAFLECNKVTCVWQRVWSALMGLVWVYEGIRFFRIPCSQFQIHLSCCAETASSAQWLTCKCGSNSRR